MARKLVYGVVFEDVPTAGDARYSITVERKFRPTKYSKFRSQTRTYYVDSETYQKRMTQVGTILNGWLSERVDYGRYLSPENFEKFGS